MTKILIIGAGRGGAGMLSLVSDNKDSEVIGIADIDGNAEGLKIARKLGIPTSQDYRVFLDRRDIDLIMNLTDENKISEEIRNLKPGIEVLGGTTARFLWRIAVNHKKQQEEKTRLAENLEKSNQKLFRLMEYHKNILEHSPDMIITTDRDMKTILYFNSGAEKMLGFSSSDMVGQYVDTLYANENERESILHLLDKSGSLTNHETTLRTKDNRIIHILLTISYLKDSAGNRTGTIGISKNITRIKRLENQLKETNLELESFVYTVSHDLKAPLRAIHGFSGFLIEDYKDRLDDEGKQFLDRIKEGAGMMKALIDDLLELSRVGRAEVNFESFSSKKIVDKALSSNKFQLDEKGGRVHIESTLPEVLCDKVRMIQLFANLINNSIKYSSPDRPPIIQIACRETAGEWVFTVEDNGIGIKMEHKKKIFEIFQRLHPSEDYDGTGIGLTIIKKIVTLHSGKVWVQSEVGKGSTFFISLPKLPRKQRKRDFE
ncbi:MAG: ATP-binding protein [Nitrospinota bacterium]